MTTNYLNILIFLAISFLFAVIAGFLVKWTIGRYVPALLEIPLWLYVVIIILGAFALQGMGVDVAGAYAAFFSWISEQLRNGLVYMGV